MKKNLKEHHEESFGKDESYETFVNEIKSMAEVIMQLSLQIYSKNSVEGSFPDFLIQSIVMRNIILKNMKMIMKVLLSVKNS